MKFDCRVFQNNPIESSKRQPHVKHILTKEYESEILGWMRRGSGAAAANVRAAAAACGGGRPPGG